MLNITLKSSVMSWVMRKRMHQINLFRKYPHDVQAELLFKIVETAKNTDFGKKHGFEKIKKYEQFKNQIPINKYEDIYPYIEFIKKGKQNVLWPTKTKWFAKSSGTSGSKSKFIPITEESLKECHFKGGKDMLSIYCDNYPNTTVFNGKSLILGGSHENSLNNNLKTGDLSAIIMENLPLWVTIHQTPSKKVALLNNFEKKVKEMARVSSKENVTNIAGVPSWILVLLKYILKENNESNLKNIWPNLELYMHGGVNFGPYKKEFKKIMPEKTNYLETYNASEGFFGIQDKKNSEEMLLMLDYGIFYEFIPTKNFSEDNAIPIWETKKDINYALVISTNGGLWRYLIGDTIKFSSIEPYRFKITGRITQFINTFGEELIMDNTNKAITIACKKTNTSIKEYTVAPIFMHEKNKGGHEWLVEFENKPKDLMFFKYILDDTLKALNSDYEAKRYNDLVLNPPIIHTAKKDLFYEWLKKQDKLGRQFKVPRLSNSRDIIESLLKLNNEPLK